MAQSTETVIEYAIRWETGWVQGPVHEDFATGVAMDPVVGPTVEVLTRTATTTRTDWAVAVTL